MVDFYYVIHYIVYRFYRKRKEGSGISMLYACGLHCFLSFIMIGNIDYFVCLLLDIPLVMNKVIAIAYIFFWAIFEYIVFYRLDHYKEVFDRYDKLSDSPTMKLQIRKAKVFNISVLAIDIILLFIVDYCNQHK